MYNRIYLIHRSSTAAFITTARTTVGNSYQKFALLSTLFSAFLLLLVANTVSATVSPQERSAEQYFFVQSFNDFQEEMSIAKQDKKQGIFVFFDMAGCPYCKYMKENVLNQELAQEWYSEHFRSIRVDIHGATEAIDFDGTEWTESTFSERYGVFSTPTMIFFDTDGKEIFRHLKMIKTPERLIALGKAVLAKSK